MKTRRTQSIATQQQPHWKIVWPAVFASFLMMVGLLAVIYPTAADWVNQYNQSQIINGYAQEVRHASPPARDQLEQAYRYNAALQFGAHVEAHHRLPTGFGVNTDENLVYEKILRADPSGMMARIKIDAIDLDLPIYHGTSDETLLKGIGHLEGTSLPVGGKGTHAVLTGHRGLANAAMFTHLDKVKKNDIFQIEVFGDLLTYQVTDIKVVEPEQTESLRTDPNKDQVTLITCTPLGINTHRIMVTGQRIANPPEKSTPGKTPEVPHFPWWIVIILAGCIASAIFIWRAGYPPRKRSRKQETKKHEDQHTDTDS